MAANDVTVIAGAGSITVGNLVCSTIREVRGILSDALNIDPAANAFVGNMPVAETYKVRAGDQITFSRPVGQKG